MNIYDFEQGTPEWFAARIGIPTASLFSKLVTPKTGKKSSQAQGLIYKLLDELRTGHPSDDFGGTEWTIRGNQLEDEAVNFYEFETGNKTEKVGFITDDNHTWGCSPDRLVNDDGILEIKCPAGWTHIENLLRDDIDPIYKPQTQGQLIISERDYCDWMSYHPEMPPKIIRVKKDIEFCKVLEESKDELSDMIYNAFIKLTDMGLKFDAGQANKPKQDSQEDSVADASGNDDAGADSVLEG
jgi:hypothetical protein